MREGLAVAEASGVTFDEGFFEHCIAYLKKAGYHRSSLHQDVLRGIPTEIDWLNGKIVERALLLASGRPATLPSQRSSRPGDQVRCAGGALVGSQT